LFAGKYNGIGGHVELGEDILSAARREFEEETGLPISDLQLCGVLSIDVDQESGIGVFIFKGEMPDVAWSDEELKPSKEGYLEWVDLVDINKKPMVEDLYLLLPRVVSMSRSEPPFFARSIYIEDGPTIVFADTEVEQTKTQRHSSR
jgi:8-oxo-dGTP diphosphatase